MTIFPEFERQLRELARRQSGRAAQPVRRERGPVRWMRRAGQAAPSLVAVAAAIAVMVFAVVMIRHGHGTQSSPGVHPPGGDAQALTYVRAVDRKVMGRGTCRPVSAALPAVRQGTPNRALLSLLGVLHRPARPTDKLPAALRQNASNARETYIHYIRLARVTAGVSYYVVPADSTFRGPTFGSACYAALRTAMRAELAHVPPQLHSRVLALQGQEIARLQALSQQAAQGGVCLMSNSQYANGGTCGATASQVARHGLLSVYGYISGVVPDGVASVTLRYPAASGSPSRTVTADVVGNVFATAIAQPRANVHPTMTWHSASGATLKTIPGTRDSNGPASGWCGGNAGSRPGTTVC